jgi:DNA-binding NtrC family response regulator
MMTNAVGSQRVLLVVDDEPDILEILLDCATRANIRAIGATSAQEAEELMRGHDVFLFSLDVRMPGEDGLSFYARMKDSGCQIPAVLISASMDSGTLVKANNLGIETIVEKPFSTRNVCDVYKRYFEAAQSL